MQLYYTVTVIRSSIAKKNTTPIACLGLKPVGRIITKRTMHLHMIYPYYHGYPSVILVQLDIPSKFPGLDRDFYACISTAKHIKHLLGLSVILSETLSGRFQSYFLGLTYLCQVTPNL